MVSFTVGNTTFINRGTMTMGDLILTSDIRQYNQDLKDFFGEHLIGMEGEEDEVRFIGEQNSKAVTSDEIVEFLANKRSTYMGAVHTKH